MKATSPKQLLLIRELFRDAERLIQNGVGELDRFKAILLFDLAVERFCNVALTDALSTTKNPEPHEKNGNRSVRFNWENLFKSANKEIEAGSNQSLPYFSDLLRMHQCRNQAQHSGIIPSATTIEDAYNYTHLFFVETFQSLYGYEFEHVNLTSLIANPSLKLLLEESQDFLKNHNYLWAAAGMSRAIGQLVTALSGHNPSVSESNRRRSRSRNIFAEQIIYDALDQEFEDFSKLLDEHFNLISQHIILNELGINAVDLRKAQSIIDQCPSVTVFPTKEDDEIWHIVRFAEPSAEELWFLWRFTVDVAYRAQSAFPQLTETISIVTPLSVAHEDETNRINHSP